MGIIDGEISTIRNEVYGEEIRTAIYTAFEKLSNGIPSSDEIYEIIEEAIGSGDVLKFKGELADNNVFDLNAIKHHGKNPGVFTVEQRNSYYSHMPIDSDDGYYVLVDLSTDDTFVVQTLFPVDLTADGTFWVRMKLSTNSNESYGWYRIGSGGASALTVKGNLETVANLNAMSAVEDQGIYRIVSSWSYSGLPSGFGGIDAILKNYIFTLSSSSSTVVYRIQELSYVDGSKSWIRGKSGTATFATSDWKEVAGSGSGGTVDPQDIEDAVFDYLTHDADLNQIIADYIGDQGSVDEASVKGWIEGYVDKDNSSNAAGKAKFNASVNALIQAALSGYSATDRTYSSDVNQAVTGFLTANSDLSNTNKSYITDARDEYSAYNDTVKPSVADGVVGLAAFRMAVKAIEPYRSSLDIQSSLSTFANSSPNREDTGRAISTYNQLNNASKMAVADGILGLAALKRTEWFPTPQMYGAYADGVHDDKNAIQEAIDANRGKTLYFPAGTYIISDQITVGWADHTDPLYANYAYTDLIFDPSAIIKAGNDIPEGTEGHVRWAGTYTSPKGMIRIGEGNWHDVAYPSPNNKYIKKARKKIFKGGVFDSNRKYVSWIIQVSQDVMDFDMSDSVILATNDATGLAIGSQHWIRKKTNGTWAYYGGTNTIDKDIARGATSNGEPVEFVVSSMDAYVHHITLLKYYYDPDELQQKYKEASGGINQNRASGIIIYASDNNFDNIRIYYFKRQVKITRGSGNYFSDVHTLGLKTGEWKYNGATIDPTKYSDAWRLLDAEGNETGNPITPTWTLLYDTTHYGSESTGFYLEQPTGIILDQCYVDTDNHFVYEANLSQFTETVNGTTKTYTISGGHGSKIEVSQCTHLQYNGANKDMTSFYLVSGDISKLYVDGFFHAARGNLTKEGHSNRHRGVQVSTTYNSGIFFESQANCMSMSFRNIRIEALGRLMAGDLLRGAASGQKGSVLFAPTSFSRATTTGRNGKWYQLCDLPVSGTNASASPFIEYRVTLWITGRTLTFPIALRRETTPTTINGIDYIDLRVNLGSKNATSDFDKSLELCFEEVTKDLATSPNSYKAYRIWIRIVDNKVTNGTTTTFPTYTLRRAIFDSAYAITPATSKGSYDTLNAGTPAMVKLVDAGDTSTTGHVVRIKGNDKKLIITEPLSEA